MIIMTCAIAFNFNSFLINIQSKQAEQIIHTHQADVRISATRQFAYSGA